MSTIAQRLGGSKATLYNYFRSKEELFEAYVRRHCSWHKDEIFSIASEAEDVPVALQRMGHNYLRMVMSDNSLRHFRMITAEAERWPQIGHVFYESGPANGAAILASYLTDARKKGLLNVDDPLAAAHQFIALCQNRLLKARLCAAANEPSEQEGAAEVARAVKLFMAAYGP